jgi:GAF domain-containing protein
VQDVEQLDVGARCSVRLIDSGGATFQPGIAPSLPPDYNDLSEGRSVQHPAGPCGLAASLNAQVIVPDVAAETRWDERWRSVTLAHGLRSVWSTPILSRDQKVLGTFVIYKSEPGNPSAFERSLIDQLTHIASVAIERAGSDAALKRSEAFLVEAQRLSSTGGFSWDLTTDRLTWSGRFTASSRSTRPCPRRSS